MVFFFLIYNAFTVGKFCSLSASAQYSALQLYISGKVIITLFVGTVPRTHTHTSNPPSQPPLLGMEYTAIFWISKILVMHLHERQYLGGRYKTKVLLYVTWEEMRPGDKISSGQR